MILIGHKIVNTLLNHCELARSCLAQHQSYCHMLSCTTVSSFSTYEAKLEVGWLVALRLMCV